MEKDNKWITDALSKANETAGFALPIAERINSFLDEHEPEILDSFCTRTDKEVFLKVAKIMSGAEGVDISDAFCDLAHTYFIAGYLLGKYDYENKEK